MNPLRVQCRRDEHGEPIPERFGTGGAMRRVVEVVDRWPGEGYRYYRVRAERGDQFILRRDEARGTWQVQFFESGEGRIGAHRRAIGADRDARGRRG